MPWQQRKRGWEYTKNKVEPCLVSYQINLSYLKPDKTLWLVNHMCFFIVIYLSVGYCYGPYTRLQTGDPWILMGFWIRWCVEVDRPYMYDIHWVWEMDLTQFCHGKWQFIHINWKNSHSVTKHFYLRLSKRLSKQSRRMWFETPSRLLWRHCDALNSTGCCDTLLSYI